VSVERRSEERMRLSEFSGYGYDKGRSRAWQIAWIAFQSTLFRRWWFPAAGRRAVLRSFGATVGRGVLVRHNVTIHWPWKLSIGDHSWIGDGAWILNLEPVAIGDNTCISQGALLCTGSHNRASPTFEFDNAPIVIGSGVWIAARAVVLRGVSIGDGCVVGATALVSRSLAPGQVVVAPRALVLE
jgi:putative colanic acid biosynthesis acetyltransferase WcaF